MGWIQVYRATHLLQGITSLRQEIAIILWNLAMPTGVSRKLSARIVFLLFAEQQNSLARLHRVCIFLLPFPVSELKTAKLNGNTIYPLIFGEICYLFFNHLFHLFFTVLSIFTTSYKGVKHRFLKFAFKFSVFTGMTFRCDSLAFV